MRARVVAAIEALATDPGSVTNVRKLKGIDGWRIRVGDWRVRFKRDETERVILVQRVLPRGRAYDR